MLFHGACFNVHSWFRCPISWISFPCWEFAVSLLQFQKDWILWAKGSYDKRLPTFPMITFPKVNANVSTEGNISPAFFNNLLAFTAFPFMMTAPAALRISAPLRDWNLLVTALPGSYEWCGAGRLLIKKIREDGEQEHSHPTPRNLKGQHKCRWAIFQIDIFALKKKKVLRIHSCIQLPSSTKMQVWTYHLHDIWMG